MSYIGKEPSVGNFVKLDAISVVNGQAGYTMQSSSVNFTPESANHMLVSLNGVIQAPISSFTVSGSTITFASALSTGDVIDFIMVYGNVLDIGTPSDNTVSTAKLVDTSVTAGKLATDSVIEAKIQNDAVTRDKINAISTSSLPSFEAKGTSGVTEGYIQLNCAENSHGIKLKSPPHSAGQSYTLTFPSSITNGYYLKTDGSGNLSFDQVSSDYVKIAETIVTSSTASVTFQHGSGGVVIDSTYKNYVIVIQNTYSVVQGDTMRIRIGVGGTIRTSGYKVEAHRSYYSGGTSRGSRTDAIFSPQGGVENSVHGEQISEVVFNNLPDANFKSSAVGMTSLFDGDDNSTDQVNQGTSAGIYETAEANDTINLYYGAGNIAKGTFILYGRK